MNEHPIADLIFSVTSVCFPSISDLKNKSPKKLQSELRLEYKFHFLKSITYFSHNNMLLPNKYIPKIQYAILLILICKIKFSFPPFPFPITHFAAHQPITISENSNYLSFSEGIKLKKIQKKKKALNIQQISRSLRKQ